MLAAEHGRPLLRGQVIVVPPGRHLLITPDGDVPRTALILSGTYPPSRPSADLLLATLATAVGARAVAVILSGGGHDGATGATAIHVCGGTVLATDETSSAHYSMPLAAIERDDAVDRTVPLDAIAGALVELAGRSGVRHEGFPRQSHGKSPMYDGASWRRYRDDVNAVQRARGAEMSATQRVIEPGDVVEVSARRVGEPGRIGEIVAVFEDEGVRHYRVRWEDGHESLFYPGEATTVRKAGSRRSPSRSPEVTTAASALAAMLGSHGVEFEVLSHPRTTRAASEAEALGVLPQTVAKTVVACDDEGRCVRAVVPASTRLDVERLRRAVGAKSIRLLTETQLLAAYPQFEVGAVPPFGGPSGDRVVVDSSLLALAHVVCEAGAHDVSLRIATRSLVDLVDAEIADIAAG